MTHQHHNYRANLRLSQHAKQRMAQRSVSCTAIDLLMEFGDAAPCGGRASAITINKYDLQDLRADGVCSATVEKLRRLRAVLSDDGTLVTVMHRYRRFPTISREMGA